MSPHSGSEPGPLRAASWQALLVCKHLVQDDPPARLEAPVLFARSLWSTESERSTGSFADFYEPPAGHVNGCLPCLGMNRTYRVRQTNDHRLRDAIAATGNAWGYTRIRGALSNLGHTVARSTVANILREHGVEPAPERSERTPWRTFLTAHWETVAATDFFTVEVVTFGRLVTYYLLVVIELSSRKIHVAGITPGPGSAFMMQVGRNLTDPLDGFLLGKRFLILDRDKKFTAEFRGLVDDAGTRVIRLPYRSPNLSPTSKGLFFR